MPSKEQSGSGNTPIRLLVVDDELDITRTVKKGLEILGGFSVDTFNDPIEGLSNFKAGTYDMVILDIRMPNMNGFELYREIIKKDSRARVCFITAFEINYDEFRKMFPSINVSCFIKKPISVVELASFIKKTLNEQPN
jgi:two-component system, OmpR family, response regulator ChvI